MLNQATCYSGISPLSCPKTICEGCTRFFIFPEERNKMRDKEYNVSTTWSVEDVTKIAPDLTLEEKCDVLDFIIEDFDAEYGISWDTLRYAVLIVRGRRD